MRMMGKGAVRDEEDDNGIDVDDDADDGNVDDGER